MNDTIVFEVKRFTQEGRQYEQHTEYLDGKPSSMSLFEIAPGTFKFLKTDDYQAGKKVPTQILSQYNIVRGGHRGYEMVAQSPYQDSRTLKRTSREILDKDTVFHFNGEDVPSQKFISEAEFVMINRPFPNEEKEAHGFLLYSRGLGNTYFKLFQGDKVILESRLISIEYPNGQ
jgi:hypothetical protein